MLNVLLHGFTLVPLCLQSALCVYHFLLESWMMSEPVALFKVWLRDDVGRNMMKHWSSFSSLEYQHYIHFAAAAVVSASTTL